MEIRYSCCFPPTIFLFKLQTEIGLGAVVLQQNGGGVGLAGARALQIRKENAPPAKERGRNRFIHLFALHLPEPVVLPQRKPAGAAGAEEAFAALGDVRATAGAFAHHGALWRRSEQGRILGKRRGVCGHKALCERRDTVHKHCIRKLRALHQFQSALPLGGE
ncbi:hypothetical protein SDC9_204485 [bioreactor metagenome]|uniref:Uncharacterized protein n=1 Tax=bioreactor metagenome TaxID=1076179 RepID=A0A645JB90_9ZZZZ